MTYSQIQLFLGSLGCSIGFSGQFGPEKGAPRPKNENFQKMKKPQIFSLKEQVYQISANFWASFMCTHRHRQKLSDSSSTEVENFIPGDVAEPFLLQYIRQ